MILDDTLTPGSVVNVDRQMRNGKVHSPWGNAERAGPVHIYIYYMYTRIRICVNVSHSHTVYIESFKFSRVLGTLFFFLCKSDDILYCQAASSLWHWMLWAIWAPCLQLLWSDRWF